MIKPKVEDWEHIHEQFLGLESETKLEIMSKSMSKSLDLRLDLRFKIMSKFY